MQSKMIRVLIKKNWVSFVLCVIAWSLYFLAPFLPPLVLKQAYAQINQQAPNHFTWLILGWTILSLMKIATGYASSFSDLFLRYNTTRNIIQQAASSFADPNVPSNKAEEISYATFYDIHILNDYIYWLACIPSEFTTVLIALFPLAMIHAGILLTSIMSTFIAIGWIAVYGRQIISSLRTNVNLHTMKLSRALALLVYAQKRWLSSRSKNAIKTQATEAFLLLKSSFLQEIIINQLFESVFAAVSIMVQCGIIYLLVQQLITERLSLETFLLALTYLSSLSDTAYYFGCYFTRYYQANLSAKRLTTFYPRLNHFSKYLELPELECLEIVKPTQDGKQHIVVQASDIIALYAPQDATRCHLLRSIIFHPNTNNLSIFWNGKPLSEHHRLSSRAVYCPQRISLLPATIHDLICAGVHNPNRLDEVLFITGIDTELRRLQNGLQTKISLTHSGVSGGQLQRIALARSLFLPADLYLLEHATSSIDQAGAAGIWQRLFSTRRQSFIIASNDQYLHEIPSTKTITIT